MKQKAFTLVELLAVILVLGIILAIAIPKMLNISSQSRINSMKDTIRIIADRAETEYFNNKTFGITDEIKCRDLANLSNDYASCSIAFDDKGKATVTIFGRNGGKFDKLKCIGTKDSINCDTREIKTCTYEGELVQGAEYTDGQYTYRYKEHQLWDDTTNSAVLVEIPADGWNVRLTDPTSTDPVTTELCNTINDKPIVSMARMFTGSKATSIDLSSFDTSNVINMEAMFARSMATRLNLDSFDTSKVTSMRTMFSDSNVTSLDLSNFNTSNVTLMTGMFTGIAASSLNLSGLNTNNVTDMRDMFRNSKTQNIDLSNFNTSNVTLMTGMFYQAETLKLDLSSFDMSNVSDTDSMFFDTYATIGYSKTWEDADILNATSGKPSTLVFRPKENPCTYEGELVQGAKFIDGQYTYTYKEHQVWSESLNSRTWEEIPKDGWHVILTDRDSTEPVTTRLCTSINDKPIVSMTFMFASTKTTDIDTSSFDTSNVITMNSMFANSAVTTLDLSSFDTSNVTDMQSMFRKTNITSLDLSGFNTKNVTNMKQMFELSKLTTVDLSNFNTRNVVNMQLMFSDSVLTAIDLSKFNTSKVTNMGQMFRNTVATTLDLSSFNMTNVTNTADMFNGAAATIGYSKSQSDADKLNESSNKPAGLTFVVKN